MFKYKIITLIIGLLIVGSSAAQTVLPVAQSEYNFVYNRLERKQIASGQLNRLHLGPYSDFNQPYQFSPFGYLQNKDENRLSLFGFVSEDFLATKDYRSVAHETLRSGLAGHPFKNLFLYGTFSLDEQKAEDPTYTGKKWRGLAGGVETAFVNYSFNQGNIRTGRFASFWGIRNSLILSENMNLDGLEYNLNWGRLSLSYRMAELDNYNITENNNLIRRYLAAHRLDLFLSKNLRVGFFEAVIFAGEGRSVDLNYLNPILFFHADQLNEDIDDNSLLGFDASYIYKKKIYLYGQLLIDDYQIENESAGDKEPNQYALRIGTKIINLADKFDLEAQYTKVTNRTFNQPNDYNRYIFENEPIADVLGNDYDQLTIETGYWYKQNQKLGLLFDYLRQGEGRVTDVWEPLWMLDENFSEDFPSGIVEKKMTFAFLAEGFIYDHLYFNLIAGVHKFNNYQNLSDQNKTESFLNLSISAFFDAPLNLNY